MDVNQRENCLKSFQNNAICSRISNQLTCARGEQFCKTQKVVNFYTAALENLQGKFFVTSKRLVSKWVDRALRVFDF